MIFRTKENQSTKQGVKTHRHLNSFKLFNFSITFVENLYHAINSSISQYHKMGDFIFWLMGCYQWYYRSFKQKIFFFK